MLIVAWREMTSGLSGVSLPTSKVCMASQHVIGTHRRTTESHSEVLDGKAPVLGTLRGRRQIVRRADPDAFGQVGPGQRGPVAGGRDDLLGESHALLGHGWGTQDTHTPLWP